MTISCLQQKFMLALTVSSDGQSRIYFITPHTSGLCRNSSRTSV